MKSLSFNLGPSQAYLPQLVLVRLIFSNCFSAHQGFFCLEGSRRVPVRLFQPQT